MTGATGGSMPVGSGLDARRFRCDYLFMFLVLIEHMFFSIDVSSQRYYFVSASSFTLFSDAVLIPPLAY